MGDHFRKVQSGSPLVIPAPAYNAFIDTAKDHQARQNSLGQTATPAFQSSGVVLVRNDSGVDCGQYDILAVDGIVIGPEDNERSFLNQPCIVGKKPDRDEHTAFVVLQVPLRVGKIGPAMISGITPVMIWPPDNDCTYVDMKHDTTSYLVNGGHGSAEIIYRENRDPYAPIWAVVRIGMPTGSCMGRAARDSTRTADDCAWYMPASGECYCYVENDHAPVGGVLPPVTPSTADKYDKVYFAGTSKNSMVQPYVLHGHTIRYRRVGDRFEADAHYLRPRIGTCLLFLIDDLEPDTLPDGWVRVDSAATKDKPLAAVGGAPEQFSYNDVRQAILTHIGNVGRDFPLPAVQGDVDTILYTNEQGYEADGVGVNIFMRIY